ncbi:4-hydroxy-tetrahydrodipicolinate reductase [Marinococcus sp. PL1-022]|uniref:4-hydroxy-tetrahydrodipicolinate reductase n=1 Tax=Marinococcus sp. PL1-022 TaxID=3095363 RepID=UPI0029C27F93|nr:4-hydroxy-tetrahydrodipicolinate reductase [Marinococcus sp. PL1-022]MDX6152982.1 4-hydroxy-tetrahydrodipicolinate reductase [Marinococcus sp. PL1-022]
MTESIRVIVAGPRGNMGKEAVHMIEAAENLQLAAVVDHKYEGSLLSEIEGMPNSGAHVYTDVDQCLNEVEAEVFVDLTTPEIGKIHTEKALDYGLASVVGTTGFSDEDLERLRQKAKEQQRGVLIVPNFAIGAVLMMKMSQMAAAYFPDVEITELHHDRKLDAPSGTAVKTAKLIQENRTKKTQGHPEEKETMPGARGAELDGMRIHSTRLPGLVAHQQVMFGGEGQTLTIRHDSINRASFMPGVKFAIEQVVTMNELVYGLENILE